LKAWKLRRNLNEEYAAHILRLHRIAQDNGITRNVYFYAKLKSQQDIRGYLRKRQHPRSESDLLEAIKNDAITPACITYEDITPSKMEIRSSRTSSSSTPYSRPTSSPGHRGMDSSPVSGPTTGCTSLTSLQSSPGWTLVDDEKSSEPTQPSTTDPPSPAEDDEIDAESGDDVSPTALLRESLEQMESNFQTLAIEASIIGHANALSLVQPLVDPSAKPTGVASEYLHGALSVTPVQHWMDSTIGHIQWNILPDPLRTILDKKHICQNLKSETHTARFLLHCIQGCIFRNQGQDVEAGSSFAAAIAAFKEILHHQFDESLSTLLSLVALLESYGQRMTAREILLGVAKALDNRAPEFGKVEMDPLYETVMFMCRTQVPEYGTSGSYDIVHLEDVSQKLSQEFSRMPKLTLVSRYYVAWAELENKNYFRARGLLLQLKPLTETVFGRLHLQSISCAATLARAHLFCGEFENANTLIEETVMPRAERVFSRSHPCYWEARYRQARFMDIASDQERDPIKQQNLRSDADGLLREVIRWRLTILGSSNPRTAFTFRTLKGILNKMGRLEEAEKLHEWCMKECQLERQRLWGHRFVLTTP
jgi:hypothetical protein